MVDLTGTIVFLSTMATLIYLFVPHQDESRGGRTDHTR
jgi:hypothetical protein